MIQRLLFPILMGIMLSALTACVGMEPRKSPDALRTVGYLPYYRMDTIQPVWFGAVDDLIYYNVKPDPSGELDASNFNQDSLLEIQSLARHTDMRILLTVGGWEESNGFGPMATDEKRRNKFIRQLLVFCREHNFDGVDFDWEFPKNREEEDAYSALLVETKRAFQPHRMLVTVAVGHAQRLSPEAYQAVDHVHLMSYDHGTVFPTYEAGVADVQRQLAFGVPKEKLYLGVPFFGRNRKDINDTISYADLILKYQPPPDSDRAENYYFNGIGTIQKKVRFAQEQGLAGMMIWELGQDATDQTSLLRALTEAILSSRK
ncbi:MAG TPA: glycoside hydrolase family 18 protein [Dissulfurispiraceae bacterium]|nr:glycoside hydrolase family 18 protein [Dissulfurispiraceae bacterium]